MITLRPLFSYTGYDASNRVVVRGLVSAEDLAEARALVRRMFSDVLGPKPITVQRYTKYGDVLLEGPDWDDGWQGVEPSNLTDTQPKEVG